MHSGLLLFRRSKLSFRAHIQNDQVTISNILLHHPDFI